MHFRGRKAILASLAALCLWGAEAAAQSSKFDARLRSRRGSVSGYAPMGGGGAPAGPRRPVLIRLSPGTPLGALRAAFPGAGFGSQSGNVATARADDATLDALAADGRIAGIELAVKTRPTMDAVRSSSTLSGLGLGTIYGAAATDLANATGAGVVIGVVDSGVDWTHLDFVNDGPNTSRILAIWDQTISSHVGGAFPTGFSYGAEYSNASITAKLQGGANTINTTDTNGHGTHVAGIAAGDGTATNGAIPSGTFRGMAPSADIVVVRTTFDTSDVIDGVNYVIAQAAAAGKRAVVNLSLGTMYGPHDGTSTFEAGIGAIAASTPIVVAAGNDGASNAHNVTNVGAGGTSAVTVNVDGTTNDADVEMWHPGGDDYSVTVTLTGVSGSLTRATPGSVVGTIGTHNVEIYNAVNTGHPLGHKQIYVYVNRGSGITASSIVITLTRTTSGGSGRVDGFLDPGELISFAVPDQTMTASEPASAPNVISVGSYASKQYWYGSDGFAYSFGNQSALGTLSAFSSKGPTRDGRQIPEVAGPGDVVAAAYSANTSPAASAPLILLDLRHRILRGTSMSAPVVAGILAARLQHGPQRTVDELRSILRAQARTDSATGAVPNYSWGYGKVASSPQPVSPPASLSASTLGPSSVTWSWGAVVGADAYSLYYATNPTILFATTSNLSYTHTGLAANTTTGALIKGRGAGVDGPGSFISTSTLAAPPAALPGVAAHVSSATVSWTACPAAPATLSCWGYAVTASTAPDMSGTQFTALTTNRADTSLQVTGLQPLTPYYFRQATLNFFGAQTTTGPVSATTLTDLLAPINPLWSSISSTTMQFDWNTGGNAPGLTYAASASTSPVFGGVVFSSSTKNAFAVFSGLAANTSYYFRVQALTGPFLQPSAPVATLAAPPSPSTSPFIGVAQTSFTVAWSTAGNAAGTVYQAEISASASFAPVLASSVTRNPYAVFSGLAANTLYHLRALAISHGAQTTDYGSLGSTATYALDPTLPGQPFSAQSAAGFTFTFNSGGNPAGTVYAVRISTDPAVLTLTQSADTTGTSVSFSGLDSNRLYWAQVAARNLSGTPTAFTAPVSTATAVVAAAGGPGVTARSTGTLTTSWGASTLGPGTQYLVQASSYSDFSLISGSSTTLNVFATPSNLPPNTFHWLRVRALSLHPPNPDGPWTALGSGSTLANAPTAAGAPFPLVGVASVTAAWTALPLTPQPAGAQGYRLEASASPAFSSIFRSSTVAPGAGQAGLSGLAYGTLYYFRVASLDPEGNPNYLTLGSTRTATPELSSGTVGGGGLTLALAAPFPVAPSVIADFLPGTFPPGTAVTMLSGVTVDLSAPRSSVASLTALGASVGVEISAGGLQPLKPVRLIFTYDPAQLPPGSDPRRLLIARYDEGSQLWVVVPSAVDTSARTIAATLDHFSAYAPFFSAASTSINEGVIFPQPWEPGDSAGAYGGQALTFANFPAGARIRLMSLTGEKIWEGVTSATGVLTWDGRNAHGRNVATGTYYAIIEGLGGRKVRRVAVVR